MVRPVGSQGVPHEAVPPNFCCLRKVHLVSLFLRHAPGLRHGFSTVAIKYGEEADPGTARKLGLDGVCILGVERGKIE